MSPLTPEKASFPDLLFIGNYLSARGGTRAVGEDLAERLRTRGWQVEETSHVFNRFLRLLDMLFTVWQKRNACAVALVEVYSGAAFLWAEAVVLFLWMLKKPFVLVLHGGNLPRFARRHPGRMRRLLSGAKVVVAPSRYLQEALRPYREEILVIPNPLEVGKYPFRLRSSVSPRLIWLRAFHRMYRPQMAPRVLALLRQSFPEIHLTMIGPDKGDGALQETLQEIEKMGLQNAVRIVPGVPKREVPEWLSQGEIFLNTTDVDNTPVSVLEALACGLCVVSTSVGGIPYLLDDGKDALLVPPGDAQAMAGAVQRILTEPGLAEHLSRNARRKAEQFDWDVVLPMWEKVFKG